VIQTDKPAKKSITREKRVRYEQLPTFTIMQVQRASNMPILQDARYRRRCRCSRRYGLFYRQEESPEVKEQPKV